MDSEYNLFWTSTAIDNLEAIFSYLSDNWTQREAEKFKSKPSRLLKIIRQNLFIFPASFYKPRLRKAVLSNHTTIFMK